MSTPSLPTVPSRSGKRAAIREIFPGRQFVWPLCMESPGQPSYTSARWVFMTHFTNRGHRKQKVAFAAAYPGKIVPMDLASPGGTLLCQKDASLCAALGDDPASYPPIRGSLESVLSDVLRYDRPRGTPFYSAWPKRPRRVHVAGRCLSGGRKDPGAVIDAGQGVCYGRSRFTFGRRLPCPSPSR